MDRRTLLRLLTAATAATAATASGCAPRGADVPVAAPPSPTPAAPPPPPSPVASPGGGAAPTPTPTPAPAPRPAVRRYVTRAALGLPAAAPGGTPHTITGLMLHHTAAPTAAADTAPDRFRGHARHHRESGFVDVAYHWGVAVDGTVYELRDEAVAGETFTEYDPAGWLLVVCEGDFEASEPPQAMLDAVADVFAARAAVHGVAADTLIGHRDLAATLCPGTNLQAALPALRDAIATRLATDGVTLTPTT